ncbi:MAG: stage II sporulation protein R [Defluviitaleaceae bacterium]|nr:stage II sporulation protein R [Defluviitaleaceae bacterium]
MNRRFKKELKILAVCLAIGLGFAVTVAASSYVYSDTVQRGIADNVLRFHVLAHSNGDGDQLLKEAVRVAVLADLEAAVTGSASIGITRDHISERLDDLAAIGKATLAEAGFDYDVTAEITHRFFPTAAYGDITFPPGRYETLLITLGEGAGRNWWCLMFPPLCYVEMTGMEHTRNLLEETVPAGGFALLTHQEELYGSDTAAVLVRFRLVEWWQNRRRPAAPSQDTQRAGK